LPVRGIAEVAACARSDAPWRKMTVRLHPFDSFTAGAFSLSRRCRCCERLFLDGGIATYRSRPHLIVLTCPLDAQLALLEVHVCPDQRAHFAGGD